MHETTQATVEVAVSLGASVLQTVCVSYVDGPEWPLHGMLASAFDSWRAKRMK
jgi:hypothetical protein